MAVLYAYSRVSTQDQNLNAQIVVLTKAGVPVDNIVMEKASGKTLAHCPLLMELLGKLSAGDTLVLAKLDRLSRSLKDIVTIADELRERGVHLRVLDQNIDTSNAGGLMVLAVMGAMAQIERELISERTKDGLNATRARGTVLGRPEKLGNGDLAKIQALYAEGLSMTAIAKELGVSRPTLYRFINAAKPEGLPS